MICYEDFFMLTQKSVLSNVAVGVNNFLGLKVRFPTKNEMTKPRYAQSAQSVHKLVD